MVALQTEVRPLVGVVLQTLAFHYGFEVEDLSVRDVFVAKYAAVGAHQDRLPLHRDGNLLSFSILLSEPGIDFAGGGLRFACLPEPDIGCGDLTTHCGKLLHEAVAITRGRRFVLVGFVHVAAALVPLSSYLADDGSTCRHKSSVPRPPLLEAPTDAEVLSECIETGLIIADGATGARYTTCEVGDLRLRSSSAG